MSVIEVTGLTKKFGSLVAVDHLDFEVWRGEVFGLLGPNGAGKTTTIRMLACLISPSEGSARVNGQDIVEEPLKVRETVGILTENPCLYERLTAYENLDFFAEAYGVTDPLEKRERIRELFDFFGLWERRNEKVASFSRGMKQKLAIARALVHRPPILFLDEPTAGLDPESSKEIRDLIERLSRKEKCTILLCTHRLEDAEKLANRVMIINKGRNIATGSPEQLSERITGQPVVEVKLVKLNRKVLNAVKNLSQALKVESFKDKILITVENPKSATPEIVKGIVYAGGEILTVKTLRPSLEEAYLKLVKGESS